MPAPSPSLVSPSLAFAPAHDTAPGVDTPYTPGAPRLGLFPRPSLPFVLGLSRRFVAVTGSITTVLFIILVALVATWPSPRPASAARPAATPRPAAAAAPSASPGGTASPRPSTAAPSAIALAATASVAAAPSPAGPSLPRFNATAAQRSLNRATHGLGRCKRSTLWGVARATVTFAGDGSVSHVVIGPPFTGTATGECVAEAIGTAHAPPFAGTDFVMVTEFFVPMR
jgi:hypothetical protein